MTIQLVALLASASFVLPGIDRAALDQQARAEAVRTAPHRPVARLAATATTAPVRKAGFAKPGTSAPVGKRFRLDDIDEHSAVCRAAAASGDPVAFIEAFGSGYFLKQGEIAALSEGCAVYFARQAAGAFDGPGPRRR